MIKSVNGKIAVSPFTEKHIKVEIKNAFALPEQKVSLQGLTVIYSSSEMSGLNPGDKVYVNAETCAHKWAIEVFMINSVPFILCPKELILLHERKNET